MAIIWANTSPTREFEARLFLKKRRSFQYKPEAQASESGDRGKTHELAFRAFILRNFKTTAFRPGESSTWYCRRKSTNIV
jgi:hypothetical protein